MIYRLKTQVLEERWWGKLGHKLKLLKQAKIHQCKPINWPAGHILSSIKIVETKLKLISARKGVKKILKEP